MSDPFATQHKFVYIESICKMDADFSVRTQRISNIEFRIGKDIMMRKLAVCTALSAVLAAGAQPAFAEPWERSFVVATYEPAMWYGGTAMADGPGSDCPTGNVPDLFLNTDYVVPPGSPRDTEPKLEIAARGFDPRINTYANPFAAADEGMQEVTGSIALGFNLDNNAETGFVSPDGVMGIDNNLYKVVGCTLSWRGREGRAQIAEISNGQMQSGLYTFVIRISGNESPEYDENATVEVGWSPDPIRLGGTTEVLDGVSYRLATDSRYSKVPAVVRNGVVETEQVDMLSMPDHAYCENERGENALHHGKMRLEISDDGKSLTGLIGGYRDWIYLYQKDSWQAPCNAPSTRETLQHQNQIGFYYSLQRNADGVPDPETGRNTAISSAYRITAVHAHVIDPSDPVFVQDISPPSVAERVAVAQEYQRMSTRAIKTKELVAVPFNGR